MIGCSMPSKSQMRVRNMIFLPFVLLVAYVCELVRVVLSGAHSGKALQAGTTFMTPNTLHDADQ